MLTGLYPNSTGILANAQLFRQTIPSAVSLPQAFRLDGYLAVRIGTPYHYNVPNSIGTNDYDDPASWEMEINPASCDRMQEEPEVFSLTPGQFGGTLSWLASKNPDVKHTDGMEAADAEWVLERCAKPSRRRSHRTARRPNFATVRGLRISPIREQRGLIEFQRLRRIEFHVGVWCRRDHDRTRRRNARSRCAPIAHGDVPGRADGCLRIPHTGELQLPLEREVRAVRIVPDHRGPGEGDGLQRLLLCDTRTRHTVG